MTRELASYLGCIC